MNTFTKAANQIEAATAAEDLFGVVADVDALTAAFRGFVRVVHPDINADAHARAAEVFRKLTAFRDAAERKLADGTYGDRKTPAPAASPPAVHVPTLVETRTKKYQVEALIERGDLADVYRAHDGTEHVVFKLARAGGDNDLLENEERVLKTLDSAHRKEKAAKLLPQLVDSFVLRSRASNRRVNVLSYHPDYYSLAEVRAAHPKLDYKDVVWMFKRGLMALGLVHQQGLVHGAVLPPHVLVHPENHGAKLIDWCYAVEKGQPLKAIVKAYRECYPPEVFDKKPATPGTDLYMLAATVVLTLGGDLNPRRMHHTVPAHFQSFLAGCLMRSPAGRPDDAWKLHDELEEVLRRLVGKPKYRRLEMPARGAA